MEEDSPQFYILCHAVETENYKDKGNEKKRVFVIIKLLEQGILHTHIAGSAQWCDKPVLMHSNLTHLKFFNRTTPWRTIFISLGPNDLWRNGTCLIPDTVLFLHMLLIVYKSYKHILREHSNIYSLFNS